jgi:hypothetical protein
MPLVVPAVGEIAMLGYLVGLTPTTEDLELRLFKSNNQPGQTDVLGDYTEANFIGYSRITIPAGAWTLTPGAPSQAAAPQQIFTSSAAQTQQLIYGYMLVRVTTGDLVAVERFFDGPYPVAALNDRVRVTPQITAS